MGIYDMIATHPDVKGSISERLIRCMEECAVCTQTCTSCADTCLGERMVEQLHQCIRSCLDCADICASTGAMAVRRTGSNVEVLRAVVGACALACRRFGEECRSHARHHEHCRICAGACDRCASACDEALQDVR